MYVYLEKHNDKKNQHRFYVLSVEPNLLGEWSVIRQWGRIGRSKQTRIDLYERRETAFAELMKREREKLRRNYRRV